MGFLNKVDLMKKAEGMVFQKQKETATTTTTPVPAPTSAPKDAPAVTALPTASASTTPATEISNPVDEDEGVIVDQTGNGTIVRKHRDGHKSTTYPDGRRVHKYTDGSEMTVLPNGTKTYYTPHQPKEDLLDKGAKSLGFSLSRGTTEKITDKGRSLFEKSTGKKVSSKISN